MFGFLRNENESDSSDPGASNQTSSSCLTETRNIFVRGFKNIWKYHLQLITALCITTTIVCHFKTQGDVQNILRKLDEKDIQIQNLKSQIESSGGKHSRLTREIINDPDSHPQQKIQNTGLIGHNFNFSENHTSNIIVKNKNGTGRNRKNNRRLRRTQRQMKKIRRRLDICESHDYDQRLKSLEVFRKQQSGTKVVYIIPTGPIVDITSLGQLIGPWYIAKSGSQYAISDHIWYNGLSLDESRTSIRFSEPGLFLINPQIHYHITPGVDENPGPMGYALFWKQNGTSPSNVPYRAVQILQCAAAYPSIVIQTCSTQITRYFEAGDEIFLKHSTRSLPAIEADIEGKTFIKIVKYAGEYEDP